MTAVVSVSAPPASDDPSARGALGLSATTVVVLGFRALGSRWPHFLALAVAGALFAGPVFLVAGFQEATRKAVADSVVYERGYPKGWVLQGSETARDQLATFPELTAAATAVGQVGTASQVEEAEVTVLADARPTIGALVDGRRPTEDSEVALSIALARALDVEVGDAAFVQLNRKVGAGADPLRLVVAGIVADTADRDAFRAVLVWDNFGDTSIDYWLGPRYRGAYNLLGTGLQAASTETAIAERLEHASTVRVFRYAVPALGVALWLCMACVLVAQGRTARMTVKSLRAAGVSERQSWSVVRVSAGIALAVGAVAGLVIGGLLLHVLAPTWSLAFDQLWLSEPLPVRWAAAILLLTVGLCFVPTRALAGLRVSGELLPVGRGRLVLGVGAVGAVGGLAGMFTADLSVDGTIEASSPWTLALGGLLLSIAAVRLCLTSVVGVGASPAVDRVVEHVASRTTVAWTVGVVLAAATSSYACWATQDAEAMAAINLTSQQEGTILVHGAPMRGATAVLDRFREMGGVDFVRYDLPDESEISVRVSTPEMRECVLVRALDRCMSAVDAPVSFVALSDPDTEVRVFEEAADGAAGLMVIESATGFVRHASEVTATIDKGLGGNLPGMVLPADGALARGLGLKPSGLVEYGLMNLEGLSERQVGELRELISRVSPAAQVSDTSHATAAQRTDHGVANLASLLGVAVVLLIGFSSASGVASSTREIRQVLLRLGCGRSARMAMGMRIALPNIMAALLVVPLALWFTDSMAGTTANVGLVWVAPLAGVVVASTVSGVTYFRAVR